MNPRQRFIETLTFGNPDKVPFQPGGPRESTVRKWRTQGLPEDRNWHQVLLETLGIEPEKTQPQVGVNVSFRMIPTFEEKVIEHKDGHYIVQDWMGAITEISDEFDYTYIRAAKDFVTRKWHKFPVENRDDWEEMKWRFDPNTPERRPADLIERCAKIKYRDNTVGIHFNGPFWQLREWCGFEGLCMMMIDDPDFVHEMVAFWTDFVSETMKPLLQNAQLDCVGLSEDMAYKVHSMISPAMTREFLAPAYRRWVKEIRDSGCPVIDMDSDGFIGELIPIWIESGINVCDPIEVAAENDIVEFRRMFGRRMAYRGGIDKRAIARGGKVIEDELKRVVPPLLKDGGFIPSCDHGVPPDISWPDFIRYSRLLAEMTGWV
ncbi:MAG TPA: uroporphyrinogen decarboxylase family protein [Candidatus Brocadiia bacterium]|nr:uroporphyrinogen decarboxylase family protein [Candidatus Brocadiia bacterium]